MATNDAVAAADSKLRPLYALMNRTIRFLIIGAALGFLLFLGFVIAFANAGAMPGVIHKLYAFPNGDKVGHFVLMGLLALALNLIFSARRIPLAGMRILLGSSLAFLLVTVEEITQVFFQTRTLSLLDLGFSYLGILCASFIPVGEHRWEKRE